MSYHYTRQAGAEAPVLTLDAFDYVAALDEGTLTPEQRDLGFKVPASPTVTDFPKDRQEERIYIAAFRRYWFYTLSAVAQLLPLDSREHQLNAFFATYGHPRSFNTLANVSFAYDMAAPQRPSVQVNGLPMARNPESASATPREDARLNMLRKIRPPPLKYAWTMYHDKHSEGTNYEGRLTVLLENMITIKHFWEAFGNFPMERLRMKDSIHFFKRGVRPVWEDRRNINGGSWTFRVPKAQSIQFFTEVCLLAIGEQFADAIQAKDDLCGCSLSTRFNSNLITIWNRDGKNVKSRDGIVQVVLDKISPEMRPKESSFYYKEHSEHAGFAEAVAKAKEEEKGAAAKEPETGEDPAEVKQEEYDMEERVEEKKIEETQKMKENFLVESE